ncbi:CPCC family cysteine-rich protein [Streptomyces sp. NPDC056528]|uniref:CPCC family cysteine-rich protein n=1 Tax=Streptomyces sp. NPDC056528 TaxID=3345854 RepID=UPI00368D1E79
MPKPFVNVYGDPESGPYVCPCCGYLTLGERGAFEICDVCFWEDDGQDEHDADVIRGGPNGALSLTQARVNYRAIGACDRRSRKSVRAPRPEEHPVSGRRYSLGILRAPESDSSVAGSAATALATQAGGQKGREIPWASRASV